jgi:hypothetical protein
MRRSWHDFPVEVAGVMRPKLGAIIEQAMAAIRADFPEPASLPDVFWANTRLSVTRAVEGFVEGIEAGEPVVDRDLFARLGALQAQAGRDIAETLSAFRLGGATCWHEVARIGPQAGLEPSVLYEVAESLFVYIDELSGVCARAYANEHAAMAGAAEAERTHFVRLLLSDPPPDRSTWQQAADAAGCRLQQHFAILVTDEGDRERLLGMLPPYALPGPAERGFCALVSDPDAPGRPENLAAAVRRAGIRAALGPTASPEAVRSSLAYAHAALRLALAGRLPGDQPLVIAAEHTSDLLISADPFLVERLCGAVLAPLQALSDQARERLEATLRAWLAHQGRLKLVAARLGIHPKTAKYRLDRLRELFGPALEDEQRRFELELALRGRELIGNEGTTRTT